MYGDVLIAIIDYNAGELSSLGNPDSTELSSLGSPILLSCLLMEVICHCYKYVNPLLMLIYFADGVADCKAIELSTLGSPSH